jgi:ribosomal protein S18 acetylase RimI-like enzyme
MHNKTIKPDWIIDLDEARRDRTVKLLMESVHDEGMLGFEEADELKAKIFVADLAGRLNDNDCWLLQADAGNDLAYSVVMERWGNPTGAHIAELNKAIVNHKYRGGRLVMQAFSEILKKAETEGIEKFVIDVREGTRAEKLWRAIGFKEYGRLEDYSRHNGKKYAGIYMTAFRSEF